MEEYETMRRPAEEVTDVAAQMMVAAATRPLGFDVAANAERQGA